MNRKLIINADDFGFTTGVNAAVSECFQRGLLRSATIMANGKAFDDAVIKAKEWQGLGVGIHFVLTGMKPLTPPEKIPELAGAEGMLPFSPMELLRKILNGREILRQIRIELSAQAERVYYSGIEPTHFDGHKHVHIVPAVFDIIIRLARLLSVKWVRFPFETLRAWKLYFHINQNERKKFVQQLAAGLLSCAARPSFVSHARSAGIHFPDSFHGLSATGLLNKKVLENIFCTLRPGVNELMTHPGLADLELMRSKTRLKESRGRERELLLSEDLKETLNQSGIVLTHFGEMSS